MFSEKYIESIKNDPELTELRNQYNALTGKIASMNILSPLSVEEWKEQLQKAIKEYESTIEK